MRPLKRGTKESMHGGSRGRQRENEKPRNEHNNINTKRQAIRYTQQSNNVILLIIILRKYKYCFE